ncbi:hypothetical protein DIPPA_65644 [Diplonema papillatum]|nr:hypothetical protein DIPPA_65644 [Diplonema papillatum]
MSFATKDVTYSGQLLKLGAVNKAWKERWFVLVGSKLYYFRSRELKQPQGTVSVDQAYIRPSIDQHQGYCFEIVTSQRVFQLVAQSQAEMRKWVDVLTRASSISRENDRFHILESRIAQAECASVAHVNVPPPQAPSSGSQSSDALAYLTDDDSEAVH